MYCTVNIISYQLSKCSYFSEKTTFFIGVTVQTVSIFSYKRAVLQRRPVVERRHLGRVLCGLMCPLRSTPSESVAAGVTQLVYGGHLRTSEQYLIWKNMQL